MDIYISRTRGASKKRLNEDLAAVVVEAGVVFAQNFRSSLCQRDRYIRILRARQIVLEWATKGDCWLSRIERLRPPSREDTKKRTRKLLSLSLFSSPSLSLSLFLCLSLLFPIPFLFLFGPSPFSTKADLVRSLVCFPFSWNEFVKSRD